MTQATEATYDTWIDGETKTTQAGKLVLVVNAFYVGRSTVIGEIVSLDEAGTRIYRVDGKGQPYGYFKNRTLQRENQMMYLYVTEVTPASATTTETCAACGNTTSQFCPMSEDGEGSHQLITRQPITAQDAAFLDAVEIHHEQGAMER